MTAGGEDDFRDTQNEQNRGTSRSTLKSEMMPLITAAGSILSPELFNMTGRQTSIAVAPAEVMGANGPNLLARNGEATRVKSSLKILESNAMVPSSAASCAPSDASLYCEMSMEDSE